MLNYRSLLVVSGLFMLTILPLHTAASSIIHVSPTGDDAGDGLSWATAKRTVQAGLNTAAVGDQVWVAAGTYVENLIQKGGVGLYGGFSGSEDASTFDLASRDLVAGRTILDGNKTGSVIHFWPSSQTPARVDGFTIRNGSDAGVNCSTAAVIANNVIVGNSASRGGGIACAAAPVTIVNNIIVANKASIDGGGIRCFNASSVTIIINNTIAGNTANLGGGIFCESVTSATVANTIMAFNSGGLYVKNSGTVTLRNNCVYGNGVDYSGIANPTGTDGNLSADPRLAGVGYRDCHIQPDSPCRDAGLNSHVLGDSDVDGAPRIQPASGTVDIGAHESNGNLRSAAPNIIVRVSPEGDDTNDGSSWTLTKRTVQAAIEAASAYGGDVWVRAGTYNERIQLRNYAMVYGGFAGSETERATRSRNTALTVLNGQSLGPVVTADRILLNLSLIDGFTITGGNAPMGGGVYCRPYSSPNIVNNTITANTATRGAGIACEMKSNPAILNNRIAGNRAVQSGGGIFCHSSSPLVANNLILANSATDGGGGGMSCDSSSPSIVNNTVIGNGGGGFTVDSWGSLPVIANTVIAYNSFGIAGDGNGLSLWNNCVFGNLAGDYVGVTNPTGTEGNISNDPFFIRAAGPGADGNWGTEDDDYGDLRLRPGSPCIDSGRNDAVSAVLATDVAGKPRFFDDPATLDCPWSPGACGAAPIVDMGAHEYMPTIPGDFDFDGDVDATDLQVFLDCGSGPGIPMADDCFEADSDKDGDVDQVDFACFQRALTGAR